MAHFNWTYLGDQGKKYNVGLYHGYNTGHLLIHCNGRIVKIDFRVIRSATYSFFIEEELCEINLERRGNKMFYFFEINKEADTPRNRARKKIEKKHWKQSLLFFGTLLLIAGLFTSWMLANNNTSHLAATPLVKANTTARVVVGKPDLIRYRFQAEGKSYESEIRNPSYYQSSKIPPAKGDEFEISYQKTRPAANTLLLNKPTPQTLQYFKARVGQKHAVLHPDIPKERIDCLIQTAFQLKGLDGLADFYFQDSSTQENEQHNSNTYKRLIRDVPFQQKIEANCW